MQQSLHRGHRWRVVMLWVLVATWLVGCGSNATKRSSSTVYGPQTVRTATQQQVLDAFLNRYVGAMSLDDRIGQMIYAQFAYNDCFDVISCIQKYHPGGLIGYENVFAGYDQTRALTKTIQSAAPIPVIIGTDVEGGQENRLVSIYHNAYPAAFDIASTGNVTYAYQQGRAMAHDILALGMNADLAPVVDVPCTGGCFSGRDFGSTPDAVTKYGGAWLQGLQDGGVIGTMKHFPGLGSAQVDPHKSMPTVYKTRQEFETYDLAPYKALLASGNVPGMIMSTNIMIPDIDKDLPAELSPKIITDILRNELHYDGVIITDALYMGGLGQFFYKDANGARTPANLAHLVILAIKAGDDFILGPFNQDTMDASFAAIKAAIQSGDITEARINASVKRIIRLKVQYGMIPFNPNSLPGVPQPQYFTPAQAPIKP
jgi:beta-N-acetylhexosaminidase